LQADRRKPIRDVRPRSREAAARAAQRRAAFWVALLVGLGILLWLLGSILLPFVLGMAIAYFLSPLIQQLEQRGISRTIAAGGLVVGFIVVTGVALVFLVPLVVEQVTALVQRLPDLVAWLRQSLLPIVARFAGRFGLRIAPVVSQPSPEMVQRVAGFVSGLATGLLSGGLALVNALALLAITPVVAFYLLRDWPKIVRDVDSWLPRDHADTIREQMRAIDGVLAGFARGAALVCLVLGAFYAVALTLAGLEFGLLIGLAAGAISFIPYLGVIVGFTTSVGVALYQFWGDWGWIALVAGIFVAGQILQDYFLTPRLVGEKVGLHPLWVIFGVLAGGVLFGFVGVLLAVPACAVIGVVVRFAIARYKDSEVYLGEE